MCIRDSLFDGEQAGAFVKPMIAFLSRENMMITHQGPTTSITGGIYELDGNTGFTAAVAEMLMQSYGGILRLLPAIPRDWKTGRVEHMRAYGGHQVSLEWNEMCIRDSPMGSPFNSPCLAMGQLKAISSRLTCNMG